jgi:1,4-alpha-glucan branching enzyme
MRKTRTARSKETTQRVWFEFISAEASAVSVAGSFNNWQPSVTSMAASNDGRWTKELHLLPGRYEYRFVVDGVWTDDPTANEFVPNPYGSRNAIVSVPQAPPD